MTPVKRNNHFVEPMIRSLIVSRLLFYWCACIMFSTLPLIIGTTLADPKTTVTSHIGELAHRYWQVYLMILGILPFAIKDALRVANRTLGPLTRLRGELAKFKATGKYHPITARDGDFLTDLIKQINEAILEANPDAHEEDQCTPELAEATA